MNGIRIFEEANGLYYSCDDALGYLDTRGMGYTTKVAATHDAIENAEMNENTIDYLIGSGVSKAVARDYSIKVLSKKPKL